MNFFQECMANDGKFDAENGLPLNYDLCAKHPEGASFYIDAYNAVINK